MLLESRRTVVGMLWERCGSVVRTLLECRGSVVGVSWECCWNVVEVLLECCLMYFGHVVDDILVF